MGNQASQLGDDPTSIGSRDLQFFDHTFKASIHTCSGAFFRGNFGEQNNAVKPVQLICKGMEAEIVEDEGVKAGAKVVVVYQFVSTFHCTLISLRVYKETPRTLLTFLNNY